MSTGETRWRIALAACLLVWLVAHLAGWSGLRLVTGMAAACLLPGLALLRVFGLHRRPALEVLLAAGVISPPLLGIVVGLAAFPHRPVAVIGEVALALLAVAALWPARRATDASPSPPDVEGAQSSREESRVVVLGCALAALIALGYSNAFVRAWSDSWFHAAVFQEIGNRGIPPEYPYFAGHALPYPWIFHVFLVGISRVASDDPFVLMAALNVWAALLLPAACYVLARAIGLSPAGARWSALAGVLGTNPLGVVWLLAQSLIGASSGAAVLARNTDTIHAVLSSQAWHFSYFQSTILGRFWTPSAFNFALVLMMFVLAALFEVWERPRLRAALWFAVALFLLFMWHTFTALTATIGIVSGVALSSLAGLRNDRRGTLVRAGAVAAGVAAAYVLSRPYVHLVTIGVAGGRMMHVRFLTQNAMSLVLSMGAVLVAGILGWARIPAGPRSLAGGMLLGLAVPFLLFALPGPHRTEEKFYYPLFTLLAACSGAAIAAAWARAGLARLVVAGLVISALAGAGVTSWAFVREHRPVRTMIDETSASLAPLLTADEDAALRWIREHTPQNSAVLQYPRPTSCEPIVVFGRRRIYMGIAELGYNAIWFPAPGQPPAPPEIWNEMQRRQALQLAAFSNREVAPDSLALLRRSPRPLFIWWDHWLGEGMLSPTLRPERGFTREVFSSPTVRVLALLPAAR